MQWSALLLIFVASLASATTEEIPELRLGTANEACALVATPGDVILQKSTAHLRGDTKPLGWPITLLTRAKKVLSLNDPRFIYGHGEIITGIEKDILTSLSFYPPSFQRSRPEEERKPPFEVHSEELTYRDHYSVYRVWTWAELTTDSQRARRERVLEKAQKKEEYPGFGTCMDFIAWAYDYMIGSWWNSIPVAQQLLNFVYPPEAYKAPDDIAHSLYSRKVCEIENMELKFPRILNVKKLWKQVRSSQQSPNEAISSHARAIQEVLLRNNLIDGDGQVLVPRVRLEHSF